MLRQLNLLPLLVIPIATLYFVTSHDIVNLSWMEFNEREVLPPIAETFDIASTNTGKSYEIVVQLPGDYKQNTATYPVIYVVAPSPFLEGHETILAPLLRRSQIPDLIVVSISLSQGPGGGSARPFGRGRGAAAIASWSDDLTLGVQSYVNSRSVGGKATAFVSFLEQELIPKIETQYRTTPGDRCLAGHGVGAVFTIETALTHPELFSKYMALAPTAQWADYNPVRLANEKMRMEFDPSIRLYIAAGGDDTTTYIIGFDRLKKALDSRERVNFKVQTELLAGRDHDAVIVPGAQQGLLYLYQN